jgi:hypothetical protein
LIIETTFYNMIDRKIGSIAFWILGEHDVESPARNCSGSFDGGDDVLGEAAGEGDRETSGAGRDRPADGEPTIAS